MPYAMGAGLKRPKKKKKRLQRVPVVAQQVLVVAQHGLVSMRMQVQSLALLSGSRIWHFCGCGIGHRHGSGSGVAVAGRCSSHPVIHLLIWEHPHASGAALKRKRKKKKKAALSQGPSVFHVLLLFPD